VHDAFRRAVADLDDGHDPLQLAADEAELKGGSREGVGTGLVARAREAAKAAGCEYLHVDFEEKLAPFYFGACGFSPTLAGLIALQ
jgi:hypothetical protein